MIKVLLADDHALVRAGIRSLLNAMNEVEVVAEASSGEEAIELAASSHPDVTNSTSLTPSQPNNPC